MSAVHFEKTLIEFSIYCKEKKFGLMWVILVLSANMFFCDILFMFSYFSYRAVAPNRCN